MVKLSLAKIGELAFILVVIIAVVAGLATTKLNPVQQAWVLVALMILGVIVSLTTITEKEVGQFLVTSIALLVACMSALMVLGQIGGAPLAVDYVRTVGGVVGNIMAFVAPAAIIPAVKGVYVLARKR